MAFRRLRFPFCRNCLLGVAIAIGFLSTAWLPGQEPPNAPSPVVFNTTILPILKNHCFECHSGEQADGDLQLDDESAVLLGGHTGSKILGNVPEESELFLRITSHEDGYRMPKEAESLSDSEIETIKTWIEQGARWQPPRTGAATPDANQPPATITQRLANKWNQASDAMQRPPFQYAAMATIPLFLFFTFVFVSRRRKKKRQSSIIRTTWKNLTRTLAILASLILLIIVGYQYGLVEELRNEKRELATQRPSFSLQKTPPVDPEQFTLPPYPMHPKRLGGIYYRGNDERSPKLFNGGFYRTATLEVWLIDSDGERLAWDDPIPDRDLFIQLVIERAPGTTRKLFSADVLKTTYLRHFPQSPVSHPTEHFAVNELVAGEKWESRIPIGNPTDWSSGFAEGMVYLYYGAMKIDGHPGRIHLGIKYNIQPQDQKISTDSEIWMGSLYNLNGRVFVPTKKIILLDRWFDFRPIPEIQGTNTVDPELLGIPEHIKK